MKSWIMLAAALYPKSWRQEYGDEFSALLDDARCDLNHKMAVLNHNVAGDDDDQDSSCSDTPAPKVNHPALDR
ncbi:MAG TPA: hypothetical protein VKB88_34280 [Bryobacteraceae bacterium]|nr:hypothetical protein [Bryobacteraceae bacterium]